MQYGAPLDPPYIEPYNVLARNEKTLQIAMSGRPVTVSTDRVKPSYIMAETDGRHVPARAPPQTEGRALPSRAPWSRQSNLLHSRQRRAHQPRGLSVPAAASASRRGLTCKQPSPLGRVMWEHPTSLLAAPFRVPAQQPYQPTPAPFGSPTRETNSTGHAFRICQLI
jgi:hypothetical protein